MSTKCLYQRLTVNFLRVITIISIKDFTYLKIRRVDAEYKNGSSGYTLDWSLSIYMVYLV